MDRHLIGGKARPEHSFRENLFWIDLHKDVIHFFLSRKKRGSWNDDIELYLGEHIFAVFSLEDVKPFIYRTWQILKYVIDKNSVWDR